MKAGSGVLAAPAIRWGKCNMLWQRILTALILVPLVTVLVMLGETYWLAATFGILVCLGAAEWTKLAAIQSGVESVLLVGLTAFLLVTGYLLREGTWPWLMVLAGVLWWLCAFTLLIAVQRGSAALPESRLVKAIIGLFVLVPAWASMVLLHDGGSERGRVLLMTLLVMIWLADIAAYFCGRRWGRIKLAPRISPGKTRAGAYAAIIACGIYGMAVAVLMGMHPREVFIFTCICMLTVIASIIGDLLESLMKRGVNLKDSSHLLPGHGGLLDRIDSLTAAGPVFLAGLWFTGLLT